MELAPDHLPAVLNVFLVICAIITAGGAAGAVIWTIAKPWLREQLAEPIRQARADVQSMSAEVTETKAAAEVAKDHLANSHSTNLRSDVDGIASNVVALTNAVAALTDELAQARVELDQVKQQGARTDAKVSRIGGQLDAHIVSAAATDSANNARITALEQHRAG